MGNRVPRVALWALVVVMLAGSLATVAGARVDATPNYTLQGYVDQPGGYRVSAGVTVDLISASTHQTVSTQTTTNSGQFSFSSTGSVPALQPGWWGLWVPPQAHALLFGGSPYAVLPQNQSVQWFYENASALINQNPVTLQGVALVPYNATLNGTVTNNGKAQGGASISLLAPLFNGFSLGNNTTAAVKTNTTPIGFYSLSVPWGSWVIQTTLVGAPTTQYNYTQVTISAAGTTRNPVLSTGKNYVTWGFVNKASSPSASVGNGGNVTVFDPLKGSIFSHATQGGYYTLGTYGSQTFDVILSTVGYRTVWYPLLVSPANPSGTGSPNTPRNVLTTPAPPPAAYSTTLNWSGGFGKLTVRTNVTLANDSVFPELANASVGQLWGQLALDWQHNLTFLASNLPGVEQWANSSGPFFPVGQAATTVNGTGYGQPNNDTFTASSTCVTSCGLSSAATLSLHWVQNYNVTTKLTSSTKRFGVTFQFRHPTNSQSFNYTVVLPKGYVLAAGAKVPDQTVLVPAGLGGTWTAFTIVSKPSQNTYGTASFDVVKYGGVTANVNVTAASFTWSSKNVVNSTRGSYAVIAGVGENLTFSARNSTFPSGTNGTLYQWDFGDGALKNTTNTTTNHTFATSGAWHGKLTVTSSGGNKSTVVFTTYSGSTSPVAQITVNDTNVLTSTNGVRYVIVNWSTTLRFNGTGSTSTIYTGAPVPGVISVANWSFTNHRTDYTNYTVGSTANPLQNLTKTFLGQGSFLTQGSANGVPISTSKPFYGWQFNVSLTVWDAGGHSGKAQFVVLVRDTQEPVPTLTLKDAKGHVVPTSGLVEGKNRTVFVSFSAANSTDSANDSIVLYNWSITNPGNKSVNISVPLTSAAPNYPTPAAIGQWLSAQSKPYKVNLTVTDRAGNKAFTVTSLGVAINTSTRPVLAVGNLTAPSTMTDGTSYTIWANVSDTIGKNSTALGVSVRFYLLPPSGTGSPILIGGSPSSVTFYNYTSSHALNTTPQGSGSISLPYNHTVRAVIHFNPARTGTWAIWVNATATNEFADDYRAGGNQAHVTATLNPNPIVQYEEYGAIAGAAVAIIVGLVFYYRTRVSKPASKTGGAGRLERGAPKKDEDEEE